VLVSPTPSDRRSISICEASLREGLRQRELGAAPLAGEVFAIALDLGGTPVALYRG